MLLLYVGEGDHSSGCRMQVLKFLALLVQKYTH
jgi:hypothetical protein